ncbi:hypothetical protein ABN365_21435, partial [Providencia rettgeri]
IDMALSYACKELNGKELNGKENNKISNSIMYLVTKMYDIYSMEMEKKFIINITKCFIDKAIKYDVDNYINDNFKKTILNFLTNKLKNNESVKEFVDNMFSSGVLEKEDIIKAKEKTMKDEDFLSEHNRRMKTIFTNNKTSNEMKDTIANIIRTNYDSILEKIENKYHDLKYKGILLDIIDYLKSDNDWSFNLLPMS